jgi:hypothetical protein
MPHPAPLIRLCLAVLAAALLCAPAVFAGTAETVEQQYLRQVKQVQDQHMRLMKPLEQRMEAEYQALLRRHVQAGKPDEAAGVKETIERLAGEGAVFPEDEAACDEVQKKLLPEFLKIREEGMAQLDRIRTAAAADLEREFQRCMAGSRFEEARRLKAIIRELNPLPTDDKAKQEENAKRLTDDDREFIEALFTLPTGPANASAGGGKYTPVLAFSGREGDRNPGWAGAEKLTYPVDKTTHRKFARTNGKAWLKCERNIELTTASVVVLCKYHGGNGSLAGKARKDADIFSLLVWDGKVGTFNNWPRVQGSTLFQPLEKETWIAVGMTWSKSEAAMYLNGKLLGKLPRERVPGRANGYFEIANNSPGQDEFVDMTIGSVKIYRQAMTQTEMATEMTRLLGSVKK